MNNFHHINNFIFLKFHLNLQDNILLKVKIKHLFLIITIQVKVVFKIYKDIKRLNL